MSLLERRDDLRQHIRAGRAGGDDRHRARHRFSPCSHSVRGLPQQRVSAQDMSREIFSRYRQRARAPIDQLDADLALDVGDVLGDGGLADP
jgi:hypothetical protein